MYFQQLHRVVRLSPHLLSPTVFFYICMWFCMISVHKDDHGKCQKQNTDSKPRPIATQT